MTIKPCQASLIFTVLLSHAQAVDIRYKQSGDWFLTDATDGVGWLTPGIPGADDTARANWGNNTITLDQEASTILNLQLGVDESGTLEVNDGGVLTTSNDVLAGNNNPAATGTLTVNNGGIVNVGRILWSAQNESTGFININTGGVVNVASHLWLGVSGAAEINISGTLNQTGGILGLGTLNATDPSGGAATLNVEDGGLLALNNISGNQGQPSIQTGSVLNVNGTGQVTLPNDFTDVLLRYIDDGKITGNGASGRAALNVDLTTNPGFTTLTAVEPVDPSEIPVGISTFNFNTESEEITFSWNSRTGETFKILFSTDLINWGGELEDRYPADDGETTEYSTPRSNLLGAQNAPAVYFRVERVVIE